MLRVQVPLRRVSGPRKLELVGVDVLTEPLALVEVHKTVAETVGVENVWIHGVLEEIFMVKVIVVVDVHGVMVGRDMFLNGLDHLLLGPDSLFVALSNLRGFFHLFGTHEKLVIIDFLDNIVLLHHQFIKNCDVLVLIRVDVAYQRRFLQRTLVLLEISHKERVLSVKLNRVDVALLQPLAVQVSQQFQDRRVLLYSHAQSRVVQQIDHYLLVYRSLGQQLDQNQIPRFGRVPVILQEEILNEGVVRAQE